MWLTNNPLARVHNALYLVHPEPAAAVLAAVYEVGPDGQRVEVRGVESRDDVHSQRTRRLSLDGGRTWGPAAAIPSTDVYYQGHELAECGGLPVYDPASGLLVEPWLRQIPIDGVYHCFTYVRTSADFGRTWSEPGQLRYEAGPDFDPQDAWYPGFLNRNEGYFGNSILRRRDGALVICLAHANALGDPQNDRRPWRMGSLCFVGTWQPNDRSYRWEAGQRVEISPERSARGLMEPDLAELRDGRVLVVWRGSNQGWDGTHSSQPGCKFYSLSGDGGRTLSAPAEWTYDDGTRFYSPSSIHRLVRHSGNGRLYWFGNITAEPPEGNSPRYPLVIGEVAESTGLLMKSTVTAIDDRRPDQGAGLQLSNFSLLEDRATGEWEMFLTIYGERPQSVFAADCYRYRIRLLR